MESNNDILIEASALVVKVKTFVSGKNTVLNTLECQIENILICNGLCLYFFDTFCVFWSVQLWSLSIFFCRPIDMNMGSFIFEIYT